MYTTDKTITPKMAKAIEEGYNKLNALWPINQTIVFCAIKGRTRNGWCTKIANNQFKIGINQAILHEKDIVTTVIHEILHSYPETWGQKAANGRLMSHSGEWARRAAIVNQTYGILIKRGNSYERSVDAEVKYIFTCSKCNATWHYFKTPLWYKRINMASCPHCKTHTIVETYPKKGV